MKRKFAVLAVLVLSAAMSPAAMAAACCFDDMSCEDMPRQECFDAGGWPHQPGSTCASITCHGPVLVPCCLPDGSCAEMQPRKCAREGGRPHYAQGTCEIVGCSEGPGRVPSDLYWAGQPLLVEKTGTDDITLTWGESCLVEDEDYTVYEGDLGDLYSHEPLVCTTGGELAITFAPAEGSSYYLVVPRDSGREGSYGLDDIGFERPAGEPACFDQLIGECE